jgi:hypothetical protein
MAETSVQTASMAHAPAPLPAPAPRMLRCASNGASAGDERFWAPGYRGSALDNKPFVRQNGET